MAKKLNIIVDSYICERCGSVVFEETVNALRAFDLPEEIFIRSFKTEEDRQKAPKDWIARGIGGVARFVLNRNPFRGTAYKFNSDHSEIGIQSSGRLYNKISEGESQFIAICQSKFEHLHTMSGEADTIPPDEYMRHLVNVRPFNYGQLPARRASIKEVRGIASAFDHIWIISGHRQRKIGNHNIQLSLTNAASRLVKCAILSVVEQSDLLIKITDNELNIPSVNSFGATRFLKSISEDSLILKLIHTMISEELLLHSAKRIIILIPGDALNRSGEVALGEHHYPFDVIYVAKRSTYNYAIAWALSVKESDNSEEEFYDLCVSLLSGYGWVYLGRKGDHFAFKFGSEAQTFKFAYDSIDSFQEFEILYAEKEGVRVVISRRPPNKLIVNFALDYGIKIIHYSEVSNILSII